MDRYEYNVRLEQIRSLAENQEFQEAVAIADSIDWRKVRSVRTLSFISEIYKVNRRYEEARDILLLADSRCPNARSIIYALCELSIRMGDLNDSVAYLKEYMELAPQDPSTFVLQYKFYDFTNVGIHQRIEILEQLKNIDYQERWGYELAKLYSEAGERTKCVDECDRLILWFGHGKYVTEAMKLKMRYEELTPEQKHRFEHQDALEIMAGAESLKEEEIPEDREPLSIEITNIQPSDQPTKRMPGKELNSRLGLEDIKEPSVNLDKYSTMNLQAELKRNMEDLEEKTGEPLREREMPLPSRREEMLIKADPEVREITVPGNAGGVSDDTESLEDDDVLSNRIPVNLGRRAVPLRPGLTGAFSELLSEEYDGQMSFNVPEYSGGEEKQITGQMNLEDLMNGYGQGTGEIPVNVPATSIPLPELKPDRATEIFMESVQPEISVQPGPEVSVQPEPEESVQPEPEVNVQPEPVVSAPAPAPAPEEPLPEDDTEDSRLMKRETMEITSDLTGLIREHREKVNARKKQQAEEEREEDEEENQVRIVKTAGPPEDTEPEEETEEYEEEEKEQYVAPKAQEVHGFDDEEKEIFAQFLPMHDLPDLIRNTLDGMRINGKNGNVLITGNEQSARVNLANALARGFMHEHPDEFVGKIATIPADLFNTKNVPDVLKALDGCALLIQHAADLSDSSLEDIKTVLTGPDTSIILMLEETKASFRILERNHRKEWFDDVFDVKIEIPTYTNDDLVFHGREYAREQEYIIDDMGVLALYTKIDERQTADHFVTIDEVEEIVDDAIRHVNRKTPGHFLDVVVGKRYDDDDMIIIREKDFV